MILDVSIRAEVRLRAECRCEFCGITETDSGGELTIDHFYPKSKGGDDTLDNLIYSCFRCNQYKLDYWPASPEDPMLWNPRTENAAEHFLELNDGALFPRTSVGRFTLKRLRLNRPALVAGRLRKRQHREYVHLLERYEDMAQMLERLLLQQTELIKEQQLLLKEQYELLKLLVDT